jgi:uncharacterized protein YndB with AHSA1/START domain
MADAAFTHEAVLPTTPERLWAALTEGGQTRRYWFDRRIESTWRVGERVVFYDGASDRMTDVGEVLVCDPPRRLSYSFKYLDEGGIDSAGGFTRVTFEIEPVEGGTRLRLVHDRLSDPGDVDGWREGWAPILAGLAAYVS